MTVGGAPLQGDLPGGTAETTAMTADYDREAAVATVEELPRTGTSAMYAVSKIAGPGRTSAEEPPWTRKRRKPIATYCSECDAHGQKTGLQTVMAPKLEPLL
jgi:hypothetical protein